MNIPPAVLVTGSEGFIGAMLVPQLLERGCRVDGADVGWFIDNETGRDFLSLGEDSLRQYDVVVHLAGLADDKLCNAFPDKAHELNVTQTQRLAERCKNAGVKRFVLASSSAVYGNVEEIATEDTLPNPDTVYSRGKLRAEQELVELHSSEFEVVCLRFGSGYGVSPKPRRDLVLNRLAQRALSEGEIGLLTDGQCYRPFVHVIDMAAALAHAATDANVAKQHRVFNVSHPDGNVTVAKAVKQLASVSGAALLDPLPEIDTRSYRIDTSRFIDTGFRYQWTLEQGLGLLVRQLRYEKSKEPEQDRVTVLNSVFNDVSHLDTQPKSIGAVTPSRLSDVAHTAYVNDLSQIVSRSSYRLSGAHCSDAEQMLASEYRTGADHRVLMMRSGTDSLMRALQVLGIKAGDYVAVPDQCFHAVAVSVMTLGAVPVFVDTRADDFNLDAIALQKTLCTRSVKAVIAVDNYGTPADWCSLSEVTKKYGVPLIVDACESLGATRKNQQVIDYADVVVVSFSFTKPVHAAGMGGALIADKSLTDEIESNEEYLFRQLRLPEINAAYLVRAWDKLHANIAHLRDIYAEYSSVAVSLGFTPQAEFGTSTRIHAPFLTPNRWPEAGRDELLRRLKGRGVSGGNQFAAQSALLALNSDCKVSKDTADRVVTLPTGGGLDASSCQIVMQVFASVVNDLNREFAIGPVGCSDELNLCVS